MWFDDLDFMSSKTQPESLLFSFCRNLWKRNIQISHIRLSASWRWALHIIKKHQQVWTLISMKTQKLFCQWTLFWNPSKLHPVVLAPPPLLGLVCFRAVWGWTRPSGWVVSSSCSTRTSTASERRARAALGSRSATRGHQGSLANTFLQG